MIKWNELKWNNDQKNPVKRFRKNGELVTGKVRKKGAIYVDDILILNYKDGKEHGPFRIEHGGKAEYKLTKGTFSEGKIDGPIKKYYDDGKTLYSKGEAEIFRFVMTNENDELEDRIEFIFTGKVEYYNEKGILHLIATKKEVAGQRAEKLESYYSNGQLKSTYKCVNNEIEGEKKVFYRDGTLKQDSKYKNDNLHGFYREYHEDGSLKSEGMYKNGYKDGKWMYYYEFGLKKRKEVYDTPDDFYSKPSIGVVDVYKKTNDGRAHGTWRYYDKNGDCVKIENYQNNYQHGMTIHHHTDGRTTKLRYYEGQYKGEENQFTKFLRSFIGG